MLENIQILWQTGKNGFQEAVDVAKKYDGQNRIVIKEFIKRMDLAYQSCDLIVSRAGAIAIAEIVAVKKPAIFVPLPSAAEDHQTKNAQTLVDKNAGVLVKESVAQTQIGAEIIRLMNDPAQRQEMTNNLTNFDYKDATASIVEQVILLMKRKKR